MKSILAILTSVTLSLSAAESPDEGLFIPNRDTDPKIEVSRGEIVYRQKATRIKPSRIVFRTDTERLDKYWLEMDLSVFADPGDAYVFIVGDKAYSGFVVRGSDQNGCKWALGFNKAQLGRDLLHKIGKIYDLPPKQIEDQTKG